MRHKFEDPAKRGDRRIRSGFLWWPKIAGEELRWLMRAEWEERFGHGAGDRGQFYRLPVYMGWHVIRWTDQPESPDMKPEQLRPPKPPPPPPRPNPWDGYTDPNIIAAIKSTVPTVLGGTAPSTVEEWERWEKENPRIVSPAGDPFAIAMEPVGWPVYAFHESRPVGSTKVPIERVVDVMITPVSGPVIHCPKLNPAEVSAYQGGPMEEGKTTMGADAQTKPATETSGGHGENIRVDASRLAELTAYHLPENHEFRAVYRQLSPEEAALMRAIKDQAFLLLGLINMVNHLEDRLEATRKLRESVMWAAHGITA